MCSLSIFRRITTLNWYDIRNLHREARYLVKIPLHHYSSNNMSYTISNCRWQTVKGDEWKELLLFRDDKRLPDHTNISGSINVSVSSFYHTIMTQILITSKRKKLNSQLHILTGTFFWVTTDRILSPNTNRGYPSTLNSLESILCLNTFKFRIHVNNSVVNRKL